ncbi:MAG: methyltransferase domain-containing protein [Pseudomonadota bacterium]|nr:methyltransferase domain-containing protein [Pseudomonadota bacterium]
MSTSSPAPDTLAPQLQHVRQQIADGHLEQAAHALNALQPLHPRDVRLPLMGMRLAERAGNLPGAVQAARHALALAPDWPVTLIELATLLLRQGQHDEALTHARRAVAVAPDEPQAMLRAVAIASDAGAPQQAVDWAQAVLARQPQAHFMRLLLAQALFKQGAFAQASEQFTQLVASHPDNAAAGLGLVASLLKLGDNAAAAEQADALLARLPGEEDVRYWHALAHGQTPATQPRATVTAVFDGMAPGYDLHMVRQLGYRLPERVAQALLALYPDRRFNLLDLGCGTGLLGLYLGRIEGHIIGVDLSQPMIEQAARHQVYSRFHQVNLLDALRDTPSEHYEAVACLDTLIYAGELPPVVDGAHRVLKPGGHFIFSCESAPEDGPDLVLNANTARYAHKPSHAERLCREAGFDEVTLEHLDALRTEAGQPVPGFIVTARKPAA